MADIERIIASVNSRGKQRVTLSPDEVETLEARGYDCRVLWPASNLHGERRCEVTRSPSQ